MFLIVGLGNPGEEYALTRHNAGFWVIDELAARSKARLKEVRHRSLFSRALLSGKEVILAKPLTFMNLSGLAVEALLKHFSLEPDRLLVIYDDMDLPLGKIRLRPKGGSGGHKGMASIIARLGLEEFPRLRLGIGRGGGAEVSDAAAYVLSPFELEEEPLIRKAVILAADAVELFLVRGIEEAMNRYNTIGGGEGKKEVFPTNLGQ